MQQRDGIFDIKKITQVAILCKPCVRLERNKLNNDFAVLIEVRPVARDRGMATAERKQVLTVKRQINSKFLRQSINQNDSDYSKESFVLFRSGSGKGSKKIL